MVIRTVLMLILFSLSLSTQAQSERALFLGNSYTGVNNLPALTAQLALSMGDTLIVDSNTPGGYTFQGHSTNSTTLDKIAEGNWDFVILQEQSQLPSFPDSQVNSEVFPYAEILDTTINFYNDCAETVFYMTWGRENGDASNCDSWPPVCTYEGMDSLLNLRYRAMAEMNEALVSPVGAVWHYLRDNNPEIALYSADGSHPSVAGTYAAACTFYTVIYRENPTLIPFDHSLNALSAAAIREAVGIVVYDDLLTWHVGEYDLTADFTYAQIEGYTYQFTNTSSNYTFFDWSVEESPDIEFTYTFPGPGDYNFGITTYNGCSSLSYFETISISDQPLGINELASDLIINSPVYDTLTLPPRMDNMTVTIWNIGGALMKNYDASHDRNISVAGLSKGIYVINATDQHGELITTRFLKH